VKAGASVHPARRGPSGSVAGLGETILLGVQAVARAARRPFEIRALLREIYLQGYRALGLLFLMSSFAGLVMAYQFGQSLARFGARQYIGQLTALALLREMMPVLCALVIGGRIVAGIAAEVGSMKATEQVDAVRALGADPIKKLVTPRVLATTIVLPLFTILGDVIGTLTGMLVAWIEFDVPMRWYLVSVKTFLTITDFMSGVVKATVFGFAGAVIACRAGLAASGGTAGVGKATTTAVVQSSLTVIVLDYLITRMLFNQVTP
jgi:phospholipid/cholesterol/gamma-HCH transport system permease protein